MMTRRLTLLWGLLLSCFLLGGSALVMFSLQPYDNARSWLDLLAKDGSLEMFTTDLYAALHLPLLTVGILLLIAAAAWAIFRRQSLAVLRGALALTGVLRRRIPADARALWAARSAFRLDPGEKLWLAVIMLSGAVLRLLSLSRPLEHDEAYTVVTFASSTLRQAISDYHLPNNHVFHTLLVHGVFQIFGYEPWGVRLPVFIAGLLVICATYFLARRLADRWTALLAAGAAAAMPVLVYYSTNARGYSLVMLFTLLIFLLAIYLRKHNNWVGWGLFVLFSALGFWSVPVFLYPYGIALTWLLLSALVGDAGDDYRGLWGMVRSLFLAGASTVILTGLLYAPVLIYSGPQALFGNVFIAREDWPDFWILLRDRAVDTWGQWIMDLPDWAGDLLAVGIGLSLVSPLGKQRGFRVSWQAASLLWITALLLYQRPNPWPKVWSFLIPILLIWSASGWMALWRLAQTRMKRHYPLLLQRDLSPVFTVCGLALVLGLTVGWALNNPEVAPGYTGDVEKSTLFIQEQLVDHDLVVVNSPHDAEVWYYARLHEINVDHFKRELPFFRAFVLVDPKFEQTLESVMLDRGPDMIFFDLSTARLVYQAGTVQVFELIPDQAMVRQQYHLEP